RWRGSTDQATPLWTERSGSWPPRSLRLSTPGAASRAGTSPPARLSSR
ncbi:unnamed protein product, partial [Ectocarpus sp. 13 AM-2016]